MIPKNILSVESYRSLKIKGDDLLQNHLNNLNENNDFHNYRRWIINEVLDPYNLKLPGELVIEYYNYCITNFKTN
jgi:hypothetical protein